jgi:iron complex outermembrane receptor protein
MSSWTFGSGPIHGSGGYRMVYTSDRSNYFNSTDNGSIRRSSAARTSCAAQPERSWDISDTFKLRGAVAEVIARPRYAQRRRIQPQRHQLTAAPATRISILISRPTTNCRANGIRPGSLLSVEYFRRQISSYIVTKTVSQMLTPLGGTTPQEYQVTLPVNASNVINGVSVGFQTAIWGGFGILTNYTY